MRFCIDFRAVNAITKHDEYKLPQIKETLNKVAGYQWYCTLDMQNGYGQIEMATESKEKTAFSYPGESLYQFKRMPPGLKNTSTTIQRVMDKVLYDCKEICTTYTSDIIIMANNVEAMCDNLVGVLQAIRTAGLTLNAKKMHIYEKGSAILGAYSVRQGKYSTTRKDQCDKTMASTN